MSDDLTRLIADLEVAGEHAQKQSYAALKFQAHEMRDEWRGIVRGAKGLHGLEPALGYDVTVAGLRTSEAEVGYDNKGQGELGNIAEFGTSTLPPIRPAGGRVLKNGADNLEKFLASLDPLP